MDGLQLLLFILMEQAALIGEFCNQIPCTRGIGFKFPTIPPIPSLLGKKKEERLEKQFNLDNYYSIHFIESVILFIFEISQNICYVEKIKASFSLFFQYNPSF